MAVQKHESNDSRAGEGGTTAPLYTTNGGGGHGRSNVPNLYVAIQGEYSHLSTPHDSVHKRASWGTCTRYRLSLLQKRLSLSQFPRNSSNTTQNFVQISYWINAWTSDTNPLNPLNAELNPICYLLALLAHHFLHVSGIRVKSLTLRLLMSYIYIYIYIYIWQ